MKQIYVRVAGKGGEPLKLEFDPATTTKAVRELFCSAANVYSKNPFLVLKLFKPDGALVAISPELPENSIECSYELVAKILGSSSTQGSSISTLTDSTCETTASSVGSGQPAPSSCLCAVTVPTFEQFPKHVFSPHVFEQLKMPSFNNWEWADTQLMSLQVHMFEELGLTTLYKIDLATLRTFIFSIRNNYNKNPFHNFSHCFCVTQMAYSLIHQTGMKDKLKPLDHLILLISALGHDLDHPGTNNAYQVNAQTDLAILYNDASPLEMHHSACLFSILRCPEANILQNLTEPVYRHVRKNIIRCIMATDMAKHGDIVGEFKTLLDHIDLENSEHKSLVLQLLIKLADISNEVRPKTVADAWCDCLLEEFFAQSDREKAQGLPYTPFMDRDKVSKPTAQTGFIQFVLLPLYELASKYFENLDSLYTSSIRHALAYYKELENLEKERSS